MSKSKTLDAARPAAFPTATGDYEAWLGGWIDIVPADLAQKHTLMAKDPLAFLRATFYRWMQLWPDVCPELGDAKVVLAVGDLHIENFGTWRDAEGRLVWGVNDFDEAYALPYAIDLVRMATSALIAANESQLEVRAERICGLFLEGYQAALEAGGRPHVLSGGFDWLRQIALTDLRDPKGFTEKMQALHKPDYVVPAKIKKALASQMPGADLELTYKHRIAGLGSLGRQRVVGLADWYGGVIAREAKALAPSACVWARGGGETTLMYPTIIGRAERCPDPYAAVRARWIVRRLAADSSSIDIDHLPKGKEEKLLKAMGAETANIHLGSAKGALLRDLKHRPEGWLDVAAHRMLEATMADFAAWKDHVKA
jgi:hypothetical protein